MKPFHRVALLAGMAMVFVGPASATEMQGGAKGATGMRRGRSDAAGR